MPLSKQEILEAFTEIPCIPCGTCGKDIRTVKQLLECRRHYVEQLRSCAGEIDKLKRALEAFKAAAESFHEAVTDMHEPTCHWYLGNYVTECTCLWAASEQKLIDAHMFHVENLRIDGATS